MSDESLRKSRKRKKSNSVDLNAAESNSKIVNTIKKAVCLKKKIFNTLVRFACCPQWN